MAGTSFSNNGPSQNVSPFPPVPDYAAKFTTENIKNQQTPKVPPIPKKFTVFGEEIDMEGKMIQSLSEMGLQQLYSSNANWKIELKKLNKSVVAAFLDLLEILIKCPDHPERREKVETIRMLFINMHHLINEYRPVQARDTLRHMMVKQNKEIKAVTEKMQSYITNSNEIFGKVLSTFKESSYDSSLPTAPEAHTKPPEFKKLSFKSKENDRLTTKRATKHDFVCKKMALKYHNKLLQFADGAEKYSDSFSNVELEAQLPSKSPRSQTSATRSERNVELEEMDEFEKEKSSSSEHEPEEEANDSSNLDAAVEFMDDDESDGEMMDVLDDSSGSNSSPLIVQQQKPAEETNKNPTPPDFSNTVELEPPSEFVDDAAAESNDQPQQGNFTEQNPDSNRQQARSHSPTPENFLGNEDTIQ